MLNSETTGRQPTGKAMTVKPQFILFAAVSLLAFAHSADAITLSELEERNRPPNQYVYKQVDDTQILLDVHTPRRTGEPRPAVLLFHGGGWSAGTPDLLEPHCRYFAERGLVAVNVQYRLVDKERGIRIADSLADARDALDWVREHADTLNIDPQRIAVAGESAGGHLAASLAMIPDPGTPTPDAALLWNPVLDLTDIEWINSKHPGLAADPKTPDEQTWEERAEALSPSHHLRAKLPPVLLIHGSGDKVVPVDQARAYAEAMKKAENTITFHELKRSGHAFILDDDDKDAGFVKGLKQTDAFLAKLGWVRGDPTIKTEWEPKEYRDLFTDEERKKPHVTTRSFTLYDWPYLDGQWEGIVVDDDNNAWFSVSTHTGKHHAQVFQYNNKEDRVTHVGGIGQAVGETLYDGAPHDKIHSRMFQRGDTIVAGTCDGRGYGDKSYKGGHWLSIDRETGKMTSLGKSITGDGLICVEYDPYNDLLYGHTNHKGRLTVFDPKTGEERDLGFPHEGTGARWPRGLTFMIPPSGRVYGFRRPDCSVWEYDPETGDIRVLDERPPIPEGVKNDPDAREEYRRRSAHMTLWDEQDQCFYFIRSYDEALCKFFPPTDDKPARFEVVRETLRPEGLEHLWGNRAVSCTLVIHDRTVWYVSPTGWSGESHLVSYNLDTDEYQHHGPIIVEGDRRVTECHSLAAGKDGKLYGVAFVFSKKDTADTVRRNAMRGNYPFHPRFIVIDPEHDLQPARPEPVTLEPR